MKIQTIVVAGGNTAGLLAALTLKRRLPQLQVRVIRFPNAATEWATEGTTPVFPKILFEYLQLKPGQFFREVEPTWKLGTRFLWGPRSHFFQTFGREYEQPAVEFPRSIGFYDPGESQFVGPSSALMAHHKAFPRRPDGLPQLNRQHGFHVESAKVLRYLENRCREYGVTFTEENIREVERSEEGVGALRLGNGERVTAELYIDASGSQSILLGETLREPFVPFENAVHCDRALLGGWARTDEIIEPYTTVETMDAGWCAQIEHEYSIHRWYVYSSRFISDEQALAELMAKNPKITEQPRVESFRSGRYARNWVGNVAAIGDAAGFIEPLEATALKSACVQASTLADALADSLLEPTPSLVEFYNEYNARDWDEIRDFLAVHYAFNSRLDTPFWNACREKTDLGKAARIVRFYKENGPSLLAGPALVHLTDPFGLDGYLTLLIGQGVPHAKPYRPSAAEHHAWKKRLTHLESHSQRGMTVKEALDAMCRANWPDCCKLKQQD